MADNNFVMSNPDSLDAIVSGNDMFRQARHEQEEQAQRLIDRANLLRITANGLEAQANLIYDNLNEGTPVVNPDRPSGLRP